MFQDQLLQWLNSNFGAGVMGAFFGAVIGGLISYALQQSSFNEQRKLSDADAKQRDQTLLVATVINLVKAQGHIAQIDKHLAECVALGRDQEPPMSLAQSFRPIVNLPPPINFSTDQLALLLRLEENRAFELVLSLDTIHNGYLDSLHRAAMIKAEILQKIPVDVIVGEKATGYLDQKITLAVQQLTIGLESILEAISADTKRSLLEAQEALTLLNSAGKEKLHLKHKLELL